jgi:hypothetical protein
MITVDEVGSENKTREMIPLNSKYGITAQSDLPSKSQLPLTAARSVLEFTHDRTTLSDSDSAGFPAVLSSFMRISSGWGIHLPTYPWRIAASLYP